MTKIRVTSDFVTGGALVLAGFAMYLGARGFSAPPTMSYGAGFFPKIVAGGMAISGLLIVLADLRGRLSKRVTFDARGAGRVALLVAMIAAYALALNPLGFHLATVCLLFMVTRFYGGGWISAGVLSVAATLILHFVFYSVMRVSLPWGVMLPFAW